jgi:hypothetical protein
MDRMTAKRHYDYQRRNAQTRIIAWRLTLDQWIDIWQASGRLHQRGRGAGCYVMSRINDTGAYELGNVQIVSVSQNSRDSIRNRSLARQRHPERIEYLERNRINQRNFRDRAKNKKTH